MFDMVKFQTVNRFLLLACLAGATLTVSVVRGETPRPNVLFIAIDDLVPTLGCYGDTTAITPEIDALAGQGLTFLNHHCVWSVCGPSRVALATSLTPEETGVMGFRAMRHPDNLPDVITMPQHFKNQGYETACTGKFFDPRTVGEGPIDEEPDSKTYNQFFKTGRNVDDPLSWSISYVKAVSGFAPDKVIFNPGETNETKVHVAYDATEQDDSEYGDHKILTEGITLMQTLSGGSKPFFLAVGFKKPHLAFVAPKRMWDKHTRANLPLASFQGLPTGATSYTNDVLGNNAEIEGYARPGASEPTMYSAATLNASADQQRALIHGYYACTSWVDFLVGELRAELAATDDPVQTGKKLSETTIIVLWGDHGFHLGDHGRWAKHSGMERSTSSPLIIFDPRNPNHGAKTNAPVSTLDIYPTLCELAGLPIPSQPMDNNAGSTGRPLKGRSVVPILNDPTVSVNTGAINLFKKGNYGYSYRTKRFRYIEWVDGSNNVTARDLYDYTLDPLETKNLAGVSGYEAVVYQLSRAIRAETGFRDSSTRLQMSAPITTGGDAYLPFVHMESGAGHSSLLHWPSVGGQTFKLLSNMDLSAAWPDFITDLVGDQYSYSIPAKETRRFFRVAVGANTPPLWVSDPFTALSATLGDSYSGNISSMASDPDSGDALIFSKVDGPDWLDIAGDGGLSGTPTAANADYFIVKATDNHGAFTVAKLQISVMIDNPSQTEIFTVDADAHVKEADGKQDDNYGSVPSLELKKNTANSSRLSYLKFNITGISGTISTVKLYLHSQDENDTIHVHAVSATPTWAENAITWNSKPALEGQVGSGTAIAGNWFSIDVSGISGNGTYTLALDEQGGDAEKLDSKEGGFAPYLEIITN